jgi:tetratricopeptide (TPR) repeat protein
MRVEAARILRLPIAAACVALAACAQSPPTSPPAPMRQSAPPPVDARLAQALERHRKLALEARRDGDFAAEADQWQILALLAPADPTYPRERAATQARITAGVAKELQEGQAALAAGDLERASVALLRVLALDPDNADAAKSMRDIDRRRLTRIQAAAASRAARASAPAAMDGGDGFDLDQAFELFRAGDTAAGLREFHLFVDANRNNRPARQRIAAVVAERAKQLDDSGSREQALGLYEEATSLRGDTGGAWTGRIAALRRTLSVENYDKAVRIYRSDIAQAIKLLEASVKYDPANTLAAARLKEARAAQTNLKRIEQRGKAQP